MKESNEIRYPVQKEQIIIPDFDQKGLIIPENKYEDEVNESKEK